MDRLRLERVLSKPWDIYLLPTDSDARAGSARLCEAVRRAPRISESYPYSCNERNR
jgi:hypothetical protein